LARIQTEVFELQLQGINAIIVERLLDAEAKKENTTVEALVKKNVDDKVGAISDQEVKEFYEKNKPRFGGRSFDEIQDPLKKQLAAQKAQVYRTNYLDRLTQNADIKILISRPRIEVSADDDPFQGPENAPVTLIEFTDFQCPYCGRARPVVQQILDTYGDKVRYVVRDFPLNFHANAKKAAEAAHCAGDQGKYWDFNKKLWEYQSALENADLKKYAQDLNLDAAKFAECLDGGKYSAEVDKDISDGAKAGVSGTPSFFINGQMITGARPFEHFQEIIDMELK
jgi:protein-disulfide isomerase